MPEQEVLPRAHARSLPAAMRERMWKPGQSGNPSGVGGKHQEVLRLARENAPEAILRQIELMGDQDSRVAIVATQAVLERAFGKPKEYDPKSEAPDQPPIDPSQFSGKQREQIKRALLLLLGATPADDNTVNGT